MDPNLDLLRGKQSLMREMRKTRSNAGDLVTRQDIFLFLITFNIYINIMCTRNLKNERFKHVFEYELTF